MNNMLGSVKQKLGKKIRKIIRKARMNYDMWKYAKYKPNYVFNIRISCDMQFKMTFKDYKLDATIVERIEGRREIDTMAIIRSLVRRGSKVLELGGCYGYFTSIMALCVGQDGKVVSIEGTPNNFNILRENMMINSFKNVDMYNFFIASSARQIYFKPEDHNPYEAINRLKENDYDSSGMVTVATKKVSSFLKDISFVPDYIFMDIEGFEVDVLSDLSQGFFNEYKPVILFETHPYFYKENRGLDYLTKILDNNEYYYRFIESNLICFPKQQQNI